MKKYSVVFASRHGQTKKIAGFIRDKLEPVVDVELCEVTHANPDPSIRSDTDTVIIGAPVYVGRFPKKIIQWVRKHKAELRSKRIAFFSVTLNAADKRSEARKADDRLVRDFINATGLVPAYVVSFEGALDYPGYGWVKRLVMKRISSSAGGPTDTSRHHEMTDWGKVTSFAEAIVSRSRESIYSTQNRFASDRNMDRFMPEFEQIWSTQTIVRRLPEDVFAALSALEAREMRLANVLTKVRTLGVAETSPPGESFMESAEKFGNVLLAKDAPREIVMGLIGRFWQLGFGIKSVKPGEFTDFNEPGYAKVVSSFLVEPIPGSTHSRVYSEMRIHCTSPDAARKFAVYWALLNPGIKLYMRSALAALHRRVETFSVLRRTF